MLVDSISKLTLAAVALCSWSGARLETRNSRMRIKSHPMDYHRKHELSPSERSASPAGINKQFVHRLV